MTCIVGVETPTGIIMGGDSAAVGSADKFTSSLEKVFFIEDTFIIGYTVSFRLGQLIQYKFFPPEQTCEDDLEYLSTVFVDELKSMLDEEWGEDDDKDPQLLIGYKGKIYILLGNYQINRCLSGYNSIGCGANWAMGSLFCSAKGKKPLDKKAVITALEAATEFSTGVCGPYTLKELKTTINDKKK